MIWFLTSFTSFYFQKFLNVVRVLNQAYVREKSTLKNTTKPTVSFKDAVSFKDVPDTVDGGRTKQQQRGTLSRKMSFAGGVDGTGQSIAILTSGGDSQGVLLES